MIVGHSLGNTVVFSKFPTDLGVDQKWQKSCGTLMQADKAKATHGTVLL